MQTLGEGKSDPQAGERAGADGDGDLGQVGEGQRRAGHHFGRHRRQPLLVAALHRLGQAGKHPALVVEHADLTGGEAGVDDERPLRQSVCSTRVTSGT